MNLHVIEENRNPKMRHTSLSNWPGPSLLRRLTAPSLITEGRISLAAALVQATSSSSLAASADCNEKDLKLLRLTVSRNAETCHLLVSAEARRPYRNL